LNVDCAPSDAALIAAAIEGNDAAFGQLVARHKNWVHRFVRRYVGGAHDDAFDVAQDAFFAAWLALSRYDPEQPFEAWLRRIALNKCRDRARRNAVRSFLVRARVLEDGSDELPSAPDPAPGPEAVVTSREQLRQLEAALGQLPRGLMEPLLLTTLEGLSHHEAGKLLGLNAKAVEMRVYRARERLRHLKPGERSS
jgi:RNA polymerase sigma-70 factor (ECF subfamily)